MSLLLYAKLKLLCSAVIIPKNICAKKNAVLTPSCVMFAEMQSKDQRLGKYANNTINPEK